MILIQIILITLLLAIGFNFITFRNRSRIKAIKKILLLLTIPSAVFVVLFPSTSTDLAHLLGVGRGADLLLYGLTVIVIFQIFDSYVKNKEEQKRIAVLVRKIAIIEAEKNTRNKEARKT